MFSSTAPHPAQGAPRGGQGFRAGGARLHPKGAIDGALFVEFTSNNFLRLTGNATGVEARIGIIYKEQGLAAAHAWIETNLRPKMEERLHHRRRHYPHHRP